MKIDLPPPSCRPAEMHHINVSRATICNVSETCAYVMPSADSDATGRVDVRVPGWHGDQALAALQSELAQMLADVIAMRDSPIAMRNSQ